MRVSSSPSLSESLSWRGVYGSCGGSGGVTVLVVEILIVVVIVVMICGGKISNSVYTYTSGIYHAQYIYI